MAIPNHNPIANNGAKLLIAAFPTAWKIEPMYQIADNGPVWDRSGLIDTSFITPTNLSNNAATGNTTIGNWSAFPNFCKYCITFPLFLLKSNFVFY
ncbi:hypothetical protein [Spiroplasma endosymbiont of Sarcophaga carnaria]|uniref:hypothetical protein n=1 Tax=Spiroplasma endosymbiont of Sarcophaga carnaria TaxID=3066303 RepID=UPI0030CC143B